MMSQKAEVFPVISAQSGSDTGFEQQGAKSAVINLSSTLLHRTHTYEPSPLVGKGYVEGSW